MRILVTFLICFSLYAQVDTGSVSGLVSDKSGSIIPGAAVVIRQAATNFTTTLTTNESGFYSAPSLRPGAYVITVRRGGVRPRENKGLWRRGPGRVGVYFQLGI